MNARDLCLLFCLSLPLGAGCAANKPREREPEAKNYTEADTTVWAYLEAKYDVDGNGVVTKAEYTRGEVAFTRLDKNEDGRLDGGDFAEGGSERMQAFLTQRALVRFFQDDDNPRDLTLAELRNAFTAADSDHDGRLSAAEFEARKIAVEEAGAAPPQARIPPGMQIYVAIVAVIDTDASGDVTFLEIEVFFHARDSNGDGIWEMRARAAAGRGSRADSGVAAGQPAPDFALRPPDGGTAVTLSSYRGRKPVALIFGSYT